jgi:polyisoprenoid-binding protein YceI
MRKKAFTAGFASIFVLAALAAGAWAAEKYTVDVTHSSVEFSVKHMMITNVKGSFDKFDATIMYDPENIENSSVEVSIDVSSIDTKDEKRDEHLRSEDFLDAANHPAITFKSNKIEKKGDQYVAVGDLTIRGVTKQVELPFELNGPITNPWGQQVMGVEIDFELNRKDYNVNWNKTLDSGGLVVSDDVKVEINMEAKKSS